MRTVASPQTSSGRGRAALTKSNWGRSTVRTRSKLWLAAVPTNVAAAASGSTRACAMPLKASSARLCSPSPACAAMTQANVALSGLTPSSRIASKTRSASAWRPARPHADSSALYVITLHSTPDPE